MSRRSAKGLSQSAIVGLWGIAGLVSLVLVSQWLALSVAPVDAALPAPQATVVIMPFTPRPPSVPRPPGILLTPIVPVAPGLLIALTPTSTRSVAGPPRRSPPTLTPTPLPTNQPVATAVYYGAWTTATPVSPTPPRRTPTLIPPPRTPVPWTVTVGRALLPEAERRQALHFNRNAPLQRRIFAAGLAPTSAEFQVVVGERVYVAQRAESLTTDLVRVYYRPLANETAILFAQRPSPRGRVEDTLITAEEWQLEMALLAEASSRQALRLKPSAALQQRIVKDGFVPNSPEFTHRFGGVNYVAQRAERLDSGAVRVYFAREGALSNVFFHVGR